MRKLSFFTIFTLIVGVAFILFSCEKEDQKEINPTNEDIETTQKIIDFVNDVENSGTIENNKEIELELAVWYIEAGLNYTYGYSEYNFNQMFKESSIVKISISQNNSIYYNDVITTYKSIIDNLKAHYRKIDGKDKFLQLVDITPINLSQNNTTGLIELEVTSFIGQTVETMQKAGIPGGDPLDEDAAAVMFDDTDYWLFGWSDGKCGSYAGQGSGSDAAQEITWRVNYTKELTGVVYTDISYFYVYSYEYPNPNDNVFGDNMYNYLMFNSVSNIQNHHICLSPDEMKFYFEGFKQVIEIEKLNIPEGKTYISAELVWAMYAATWDGTTFCHDGKIRYGKAIIPSGDRKRLEL